MKHTIFFDFETGGIEIERPEIQLAAIAVDEQFNEVASFESKIKFIESEADPEALRMNHYDPDAWKDAPSSGYVVTKFSRFVDPYRSIEMVSKRSGNPYFVARLAGHNAVTFDLPRLRKLFERSRTFMPFHPIAMDTLQLALWRYEGSADRPADMKLTTIAAHLRIDVAGAHDALADVRLSAKVAQALLWNDGSRKAA